MPLYTPFVEKTVDKLSSAYMGNQARNQQTQERQLFGQAYMGDPQAMQQLAQVRPDLAMEVEKVNRQRSQDTMASQAASQKSQQQKHTALRGILSEAAKLDSFEEAQSYTARQAESLGFGDVPPLTEEAYNQAKEIAAPAPETVGALDQARIDKINAEIADMGGVDPKEALQLKELKLKIANQEQVVIDRKEKAVTLAKQKDRTSIAQAFEAQGAIENIDDLLKDDAFEDIYGVGERFIPTILSGSVALEAKRNQIVALLGLESRQKLKGQGTISDSESKALADSATLLGNPGIDEVTAKRELRKVKKIFQRAVTSASKNPAAKAALTKESENRAILTSLPEGSFDNGDGTFTLPTGEIVEPE